MDTPYLADRQSVSDAHALIERHGDDAGFAAAAEAEASRDRGNARAFCRWRQIERLIVILSGDGAAGTVH